MSEEQKSDSEIFYPKGKIINIAGKEFTILPFVLKNRIKFVRILSDALLKASVDYPNLQNTGLAQIASLLISIAGEKLIEIYELVLNESKEWLMENVKLRDESEIITAILEVNEIPLLVGQIVESARKIAEQKKQIN